MQINYFMYMNSSGYSVAAQDYILSMLQYDSSIDIKINFFNQVNWSMIGDKRKQIFQLLNKKKNSSNNISLYHCIPPIYRKTSDSSKTAGFCIFETINPPKGWVDKMNDMSHIITSSNFNKNIFEKSGVIKNIHVIPHCFDNKMFNKQVVPDGRYDRTTFISIGTWKKRKNWETLVKAFYDGFEEKDGVCLLIKTDNPQYLSGMVKSVKKNGPWRSKNTAPIYTENKTHVSFEEIPKIMKKGDIYISTSLGEGFCLPALHAMALGMPVIVPRFGGVLEYAKPEFCTYIEPKGYQTINDMDGVPQFKNCIWPSIPISDVRDVMREVWKNRPIEKTEKAYLYVHENYSYENIGPKMIKAIHDEV